MAVSSGNGGSPRLRASGASPRLRGLVQRAREPAATADDGTVEQCDLCAAPLPVEHRHLLDLETRGLRCVCRPCSLLFDSSAAGGGHLRLLPDRRLELLGFRLDDVRWTSLRIPVEMAFFFHSAPAGRVVAFYPGPMGPTESLLELTTWRELEADNPVLETLEEDVEALLVNRTRGAREHFIVPLDDCYDLVGLIRTRWKGLTGGEDVWSEIGRFFERLRRRARTVRVNEEKEETWPR